MGCENKVLVLKPSPWLHSISKCLQAILKLKITLICASSQVKHHFITKVQLET